MQLPQTPATHVSPATQSLFEQHAAVHKPEAQAWPVAQSPSPEQVHWFAECVSVQLALGPHWPSDVQLVQLPPTQIWPAWQGTSGEHWVPAQTEAVHMTQAEIEPPTEAHVCPAAQVAHSMHVPSMHERKAGQSRSDWHGSEGTQVVDWHGTEAPVTG